MDYIKWIRNHVGNEPIILNFSGCVIFNEDGKILLQKRRAKNKWGFLGGALELGESISETAIREIQEECGLKVETTKLLGIYSKYFDEYPNGDRCQCITTVFKCRIIGGELTHNNDETIELKFFDPCNSPKLVNKQHEDILEDVINKKVNVFR